MVWHQMRESLDQRLLEVAMFQMQRKRHLSCGTRGWCLSTCVIRYSWNAKVHAAVLYLRSLDIFMEEKLCGLLDRV